MGKFVIKKVETGTRFDLKAANGEVIANSEVYTTLDAAKKGIESTRTTAIEAALEDQTVNNFTEEKNPKFEVYIDKGASFRFRLKAKNGEILVFSEGYTTKANCLNGITSVRKNAPESPVVEV